MSSPTNRAAVRALRWSKFSGIVSWLAILAGLGFVGLFLAQAGLFSLLIPAEPVPPPNVRPDEVNAVESTVNGMDRENQPYVITAARGWQDDKSPSLVHLETVDGRFRKASGAQYALNGKAGLYDTNLKQLDLEGDVKLVQKDRFTALMDKARILVDEKKLTADVPVDVSFADGTIRANGMQITDDGGRILFLNGVKAQFGGTPQKGDATP